MYNYYFRISFYYDDQIHKYMNFKITTQRKNKNNN